MLLLVGRQAANRITKAFIRRPAGATSAARALDTSTAGSGGAPPRREARAPLVALARAHDVLPVAIVLDMPERLCEERNAATGP
jgi:hypothetical protein